MELGRAGSAMMRKSLLAARTPRLALAMACLFLSLGVVMPFLSRWLSVERGLDGAEIGAVLSLAQLARIGTGPLIAMWADGLSDRRTPLRVLGLTAVAAYAAFFFIAHDFGTLLLLGFLALTASQAATPLVEAAVLRASAEERLPYGVARALGSSSFIFASVMGGVLIAHFGLGAVVAWVMSGIMTFAASAWLALKPDPRPAAYVRRGRRESTAALLRSRRYVIVILACGLIQSAHAFYYGFSTLVWRAQGISPETVGWLWACGVAMEVCFFLALPWVERWLAPEALILIGGGGGVVRWAIMALAPTGWVLWPVQALHALSFAAAHIGALRLIFRETPEASAGLAQTLSASLSGGLFLGLSTLLSGVLYDAIGAQGYWAMAGLAAVGTSIALLLLTPAPVDQPAAGEPRP